MRNVGLVAVLLVLGACGDRPDAYDAPISSVTAFGLENDVAVVDDATHRIVLLAPAAEQELERSSVPVGKGIIRTEVSSDGKRLFVLSTGDLTRKKGSDEKPSLTVVEAGAARRYPLEAPHSGLAIDPLGRWVAVFAAPAAAGAKQATFVENPNEIVVVDLAAPIEAAVTPRTLRSFGGLPQRVSFTPPLLLPAGPRRLMVVETDQDVALLDVDNVRSKPQRPEVTVRLTSGATATPNRPGGVVADDGDPARSDDARIGIRLENGPNVVTLTLVPNATDARTEDPAQVPNDFRTVVNLTDVGGIPGDIVFVHTEVGLRLAAIVPSTKTAVLVDPETSITTNVELPEPYGRISLITSVVSGAAGSDTALLYGTVGSRGVAFWSLGRATGQPYRSVEVVSLAASIGSILDVPPPRPELKVLQGSGANAFYVLNLATRTASPLTTLATPSLLVSRDGLRLWAFERGRSNLAQVALADLHPVPLPIDRPISGVFDVARRSGGRSLVAIDVRGAVGATVLDALAPDTAASRSYYGLLLEGL